MTASKEPVATNIVPAVASDLPWTWKSPHLLKLNFSILSLILLGSANGYDGSLLNSFQALSQWMDFMETPAGVWLGFMSAIYWLSMLFTLLFSVSISNRFGRKMGLYFGFVLIAIAAALQAAAPNPAVFVASRAIAGCAAGFWGSNAPVLISESAFPTHRAALSTMYQAGFYIGSTLAAWVCFGTYNHNSSWAWRLPSLLQILLPAVAMPGLILCPESPRWLASRNRIDEARQMLVKSHAAGDVSSAVVELQMNEIAAALAIEKLASTTSFLDMLKTPGNRKRFFITVSLAVFSQWGGNGVVSFYLAKVLNTVGVTSGRTQIAISAALAFWNFPFAVGASLMVDRVGRRFLFMLSASVMLISYILITGLSASFAESGTPSVGIAVVPFLFIYFAGYSVGPTPLVIGYPVEIWQYNMRSRGVTLAWSSACLMSSFNIFVNPIALDAIAWKYYFVFLAVLSAYGITAFFFYPETKGYSLEGIAVLFDGEPVLFDVVDSSQSQSFEDHAVEGFSCKRNPLEV